MIFEKSVGTEAIRLGKFIFVAMYGPDVALDPGVLGDIPALFTIREVSNTAAKVHTYLVVIILDRGMWLASYYGN